MSPVAASSIWARGPACLRWPPGVSAPPTSKRWTTTKTPSSTPARTFDSTAPRRPSRCVRQTSRVDPSAPGDVVTANLTGALLVALASSIASLVRPGGTLILSGILAAEVDAVGSAFSAELTQVDMAAENEWRALRFTRV